MQDSSFLLYLQNERRYSEHTVAAYRNDLNQFESFLTDVYGCTHIDHADTQYIRSWVIHLMRQGTHSRSVKRKLSALKSYYNYAKKRGHISENPVANISGPKGDELLPDFVRESQMELMLDPKNFSDDFSGQRDRMVLEVLYGLGLRRAELINLMDAHIDQSYSTVRIFGKGNKQRILPVGKPLMRLIQEYQQLRDNTFLPDATATFIRSNTGKDAYPSLIYRIAKQQLGLATTLSRRSPHLLRHTFATHLSNQGAPLNAIKELLGHSSLASTQVYMHNSIDRLKEVYKQAHPKGEEE